MSDPRGRRLLASAGTGKTWSLTNHFLDLLLEGVAPERILATTFTRKAAGEILDRVLSRLSTAAAGGKGLTALRDALGRPTLEADQALDLLARLTRRLDRFQVRTIDSFFAQLGRAFALELGLPADWRIADESEDADRRAEALQRVLAETGREARLELLRALQRGEGGRGVERRVLDVIERSREVFLESTDAAWEAVTAPAGLSDEALAAARDAFERAEPVCNKAGPPNATYVKARDKILAAVDAQDWESVVAGTLAEIALERKPPQYSRRPVPEATVAALRTLVEHAGARLVAELVTQTRATRELLGAFESVYRALEAEAGAYRFNDLPHAFAPRSASDAATLDENLLELWFRLDGSLDHLLLDEFQDTAPVQWRVLEPLAEEILAGGDGPRSLLCVGDVKQSIYGWRQGEPRLLAELDERWSWLETERLAKSWRSSPVVIATVNRLFGALAENEVLQAADRGPHRQAAARFAADFEPHGAAHADLPGAVRVFELEPSEKRSDPGPAIALTLERVQAILAEAPRARVGVLLRGGQWIQHLLHRLRAAGISASGEGGQPLTDAEAVGYVCSLLRFVDHPDDSAAAFHVGTSFLGPVLGITPAMSYGPRTEDGTRHAVAAELRARLAREGLGAFLGGLLPALEAAGRGAWDRTRFAQLVDLAHAFEGRLGAGRTGLRLMDFVRHVRREKVAVPARASVRVMTIHASKGLEFDAVVLPDLARAIRTEVRGTMARRRDTFERIDAVSAAGTKAVRTLHPQLAELEEHNYVRQAEEALCVLYVAVTRAKRCLELLVPGVQGKDELSATYGNLVRCALGLNPDAEPGEGRLLWQEDGSTEDWGEGLEAPDEAEPREPYRGLGLARTTRLREPRALAPSAQEGAGRVLASSLLRPRGAAQRGTLVHAWLEELEWVEDFELDRERMLREAEAIEPDLERREDALALLERALTSDAIRAALARPDEARLEGAEPEVRNEHAFRVLLPAEDGDEELWAGSIDRLVLLREGERVVRAEVIDHKTDAIGPDELESRAAFYEPQLEAYRRVVCAQYGLADEAVRMRLLFLAAGQVVELGVEPGTSPN